MVLWVLRYEEFIPGVILTLKHNVIHKNAILTIFKQIIPQTVPICESVVQPMLDSLSWMPIIDLIKYHTLVAVYK